MNGCISRTLFTMGVFCFVTLSSASLASTQEPVVPVRVPDQPTLQKKAREMLLNNYITNELSIDPPRFAIDKGTVSFYPGAAFVRVGKQPELAKHPLRIPFQSQLRIELLRLYFASPDHNYIAFWEPYFTLAEKLISTALTEIGKSNNDHTFPAKLSATADEINNILQEALMSFASRNRLKIKKDTQIRGKQVTVLFQSAPAGAEMYIVGGFLYKTAGESLNDSLWLDVTHGNKVPIPAGDWQYKARWQKNQPWETGLIPVMEDGIFTIRKKPQ